MELERRIAEAERIKIQQSGGRIEPRTRFRRTDSDLSRSGDRRPLDWLFVDESGTGGAARGSEDDAWFVLAGVSLSLEHARAYEAAADRLKAGFFGRRSVTLHEPLMRRHRDRFGFGGDAGRRSEFTEAVDRLVAETEFVAFAVGIRKWTLAHAGGVNDQYLPTGVYDIAMHLLFERYVDYLAHEGSEPRGRVTFESQGAREDADHQRAYVELLLEGTQWVPAGALRRYLETGMRFVGKRGSHPMELADMLARDVFEWVRSDCRRVPRRWPIFEEKLYARGDLRMGKVGLKVFPADDIEEQVEAQREQLRTRLRRP